MTYLKAPASLSSEGKGVDTGVEAGVTGTDNGAEGKLVLLFPSSADTEAVSESTVALWTRLLLYIKENKKTHFNNKL